MKLIQELFDIEKGKFQTETRCEENSLSIFKICFFVSF